MDLSPKKVAVLEAGLKDQKKPRRLMTSIMKLFRSSSTANSSSKDIRSKVALSPRNQWG